MWQYHTYDELYHHGIKGQKWYVRRFQNADGSRTAAGKERYSAHAVTVAKAGDAWDHVTGDKNLKLKSRKDIYLYNGNDEHDKAVYEGAFSTYLQLGRGVKEVQKNSYRMKEDLVSPDREERGKIFVDTYKKYPTLGAAALNQRKASLITAKKYGYQLSPYMDELAKGNYFHPNTSDKVLEEWGYKTYAAIEKPQKGSVGYEFREKYQKNVKKAGYNALIDDNNAGGYNDAKTPVIVLDQKKTLEEISKRPLTDDDILKEYDNISKYMAKTGRKVAL